MLRLENQRNKNFMWKKKTFTCTGEQNQQNKHLHETLLQNNEK